MLQALKIIELPTSTCYSIKRPLNGSLSAITLTYDTKSVWILLFNFCFHKKAIYASKLQRLKLRHGLNHTWASTRLPGGGGEISKISKGGNIFLNLSWRGIDFLPSKGGYPLQLFTKIPEFLEKYFF